MGVSNTLSTANSFLQSVVSLAVAALLGAGALIGYDQLHQRERLGEFREKLKHTEHELASERERNSQLQVQIEKLDTALHLLRVDHRLAEVRVIKQEKDPNSQQVWTEIEFVEIAEDGREINQPRQFRFQGDKVYVDYWVVKFEDHYVEQAELNRGTSICLFRGIHGEYQSPAEAYRLDTVGSRPAAYARGRAMSAFEQQIWKDFWEFANDPDLAKAKGIRAAHGEEPYTAVREGMRYRLELRASGGLSITPVKDDPRKPVPRRQEPDRNTTARYGLTSTVRLASVRTQENRLQLRRY